MTLPCIATFPVLVTFGLSLTISQLASLSRHPLTTVSIHIDHVMPAAEDFAEGLRAAVDMPSRLGTMLSKDRLNMQTRSGAMSTTR